MPLPEQVVEQLRKEPAKTQGWAWGAILFCGGVLFLAALIWAGLLFGYEPYLESQLAATQKQVTVLDNSVSPADEAQIVDFYSQAANLQTLLANHVLSSQFFSWLEQNTEANVYYQSLGLSQGGVVTLAGNALSEGDVNQQIAIFENSSEVTAVNVSTVTAPQSSGAPWTFSMTLTMSPSLFLSSSQ
jgi:hypothetical protein